MMYALTLWPEWAYAILHMGKRVENRSWRRESIIGQDIAIHAGAKIGGPKGVQHGLLAVQWMCPVRDRKLIREEDITKSAIVAVVRVKDIVEGSGLPWSAEGQMHWVLDNVRVLSEPVSCSGKQGLWKVEGELLAQVSDQLD